jgi:hypothetical protein
VEPLTGFSRVGWLFPGVKIGLAGSPEANSTKWEIQNGDGLGFLPIGQVDSMGVSPRESTPSYSPA